MSTTVEVPVHPPTVARPPDPVGRARELARLAADRALETEERRSLAPDLVAELRTSGLFQLTTPRSAGGMEAEPATIVSVVEELSRADASTGWTVLIGQGAGYLAWVEAGVADRIVARHPRPIIAGSMAPMGRAQPAGAGAVRISGRWPYNSGCGLADYLFGAFSTTDPPRPPFHFALFEPEQVEIHDTWRVAGLRGTGSHDLSVRDVTVPPEWTFNPFGPAREPGPLYRLPYLTYLLTAMAGFPLGLARRVVDEYAAVLRTKRNTERRLLAETPLAQGDLAQCEASVRAARAGVFAALEAVWAEALTGVPGVRTRALFTGAVQHAMRTAVAVADSALRACGASQLYQRAPLQRLYRDAQAAAQHIAFGMDAQRRVGAALLDQEVPEPFV